MEQIQSKIRSMDIDISEKFIVTACEDSFVRLFSVNDKKTELLCELTGHTGMVTKAIFINQGDVIASSDFNGKLIIWKLENSSFVKKTEIQVSDRPIYDIAARVKDNGFTVFCGCDNGLLKTVIFDSNFKTTMTEQELHRYGVISVSCTKNFLATGGLDSTVALISNGNIEYIKKHTGAVNAVALVPSDDENHTIVASGSEDGTLILTFKNGKKIRTQQINLGEPCYSLDWNRTGFILTVGYGNDKLKSFAQGENGEYQEIPMTKDEN